MSKTKQELKQLAKDIHEGKVFGSWNLTEHEMGSIAHLVFMPLLFGLATELKEKGDDIAHIYEYFDQAGPRSINGKPIFYSCHLMTREEHEIVDKYLKDLRELEEEFLDENWD